MIFAIASIYQRDTNNTIELTSCRTSQQTSLISVRQLPLAQVSRGGGENEICRSSLGVVETHVGHRAMLGALEFHLKGYSYYLCTVLVLEQGTTTIICTRCILNVRVRYAL